MYQTIQWTDPGSPKQDEGPENLQYIDDMIVWGNTAEEVFEKGEKRVPVLLEDNFAIKWNKVKGPAQEIWYMYMVFKLLLGKGWKKDLDQV